MLIRRPPDLLAREITDESAYVGRREFLRAMGYGAGAVAVSAAAPAALMACAPGKVDPDDKLTPWEAVTGYNNYYEFVTSNDDPAKNSHTLRPRPWKVRVEG